MSVEIGLIELIELSGALNLIHFLDIAFYKLFYIYFYFLHMCGTKSFAQKTEPCLTCGLVWGGIRCYSIKVYKFLCSLCKFIGNWESLVTADKICWEKQSSKKLPPCQYIFPTLCNTLHSKISKNTT